NMSDLYALFVGHLADRIRAGDHAFSRPFADVGHLRRIDVARMQRALVRAGHDVGGVDGLPGYKTRRAIGRWQRSHGLKPTCFPTRALKAVLR
ncbi:MAG TPA: lytic murein transglycosylase, partial [Thermopetrobacter sp.]|nr:lytic murein transglycosylase [Thermopetrobacter sp.]